MIYIDWGGRAGLRVYVYLSKHTQTFPYKQTGVCIRGSYGEGNHGQGTERVKLVRGRDRSRGRDETRESGPGRERESDR